MARYGMSKSELMSEQQRDLHRRMLLYAMRKQAEAGRQQRSDIPPEQYGAAVNVDLQRWLEEHQQQPQMQGGGGYMLPKWQRGRMVSDFYHR